LHILTVHASMPIQTKQEETIYIHYHYDYEETICYGVVWFTYL
jgi:hypothetical protein